MHSSIWPQCVKALQDIYPPQKINMWVNSLYVVEQDKTLYLYAPNQYAFNWVSENCVNTIKKHLPSDMAFVLYPYDFSEEEQPDRAPAPIRPPAVLGARLNPSYRFDTFVEGDTNQVAHTAARQVAESPGQKGYNPLLIYGGSGLGKTHLMHAIGHSILAQNPAMKIMCQRSETFVREMVSAISNKTMDKFKQRYRDIDVLLMDDVHMFIGKQQSQEEFFHTFNELSEKGQQLVLTCDRYPINVEDLQPRLASRFVSGFYHAIHPPKLETRVAILKQKAKQENHVLSDDVLFFIANHVQSNVRELEGTLRQVSVNAALSKRAITLDFVREVIGDQIAANRGYITLKKIQNTVAQFYGLNVAVLLSASRRRSIVRPRQIAMALAREITTHSLPEIGSAFGGRDHTTVISACKKVALLCRENATINQEYISLRQITTQ